MQILITGGCGFIGSHLADALVVDGHRVVILDNLSTGSRANVPAAARLVEGDVADKTLVRELVQEADVVFHLAAIASVQACEQDPSGTRRTNLTGTVNMLDAAAAKRIPVIYASSAAVYGDNPELPLDEASQAKPLSAYGRDKRSCELEAANAWATHKVPSVGLRFFNVYGPRQDARSPYSGVISKFAAHALAGEPLTFFGDGEQTRDFIYVGDVVRLLIAAWKQVKGAMVFNGCTGQAVSLKQLATAIGAAAGKPITTRHEDARTGDIRHSLGAPLVAKAVLGFEAATPLADGLKQLLTVGHDEAA